MVSDLNFGRSEGSVYLKLFSTTPLPSALHAKSSALV